MYREDEFYFLTDRLHHDIYELALKDYLTKKERVIVKIFKKDNESVVIEVINGQNKIIKDTRKNKESSIFDMDLVFVKVLDRYVSSYELPNVFYEYVEGVGAWYRVKLDGFLPNDPDLKIFYRKKEVTKEEIINSTKNKEVKDKQLKFLELTKGIKFTRPSEVKKIIEETLYLSNIPGLVDDINEIRSKEDWKNAKEYNHDEEW